MAVNKVVFNGKALIDLTRDSVTADRLAINTSAHDKKGNRIVGRASMGDIQSISVTQLPAPSMAIFGNVYKYNNEYYCCTFDGKLNVEAGAFNDSFKFIFPPADDLYNAIGSQPDGTELFAIGYSDSNYTSFILTMTSGNDAVIYAGTRTFQLNQYTKTEIIPYWLGLGNQIIYVTDLENQIFNSDVPCCMVNMTTGKTNGNNVGGIETADVTISINGDVVLAGIYLTNGNDFKAYNYDLLEEGNISTFKVVKNTFINILAYFEPNTCTQMTITNKTNITSLNLPHENGTGIIDLLPIPETVTGSELYYYFGIFKIDSSATTASLSLTAS